MFFPPFTRRPGRRQRPAVAPHDLGVLFVHGIGNQTLGSTLTDFGTPLVEWLRDRGGQVGAKVTATTTNLSSANDEPATSELHLTSASDTRRWLLAESWWAQSFPIAQFHHVATWSLLVVPWTLGTHFAKRWARAKGPHTVRRRTAAVLMLAGALALSPALLLLLIVLLALGRVPWPSLQSAVARIQLAIGSSLGDSYMLVARPLEAAAIRTRVGRDLDWMRSRCRRVAVIAHSQGGAIACQILRDRPVDNTLLVTIGSGLRKLVELEDAHQRGGMLEGALMSVAGISVTALMLVLSPLVVFQATQGQASTGSVITLLVLSAFGLVVGVSGIQDFIHAREPQRLQALANLLGIKGLRWRDVYASADPVSNGSLHDDKSIRPPDSTSVANRGSILRDHTTYWENRDEFVALVAEELLAFDSPAILPAEDPAVLSFFRAYRSIRVRVLQALSWATIASIVALLFAYRQDWLQVAAWASYRLVVWAGGLVGYAPTAMTAPPAAVWSRSVGWLVAILGAGWFTRLWWTFWNRAAMRDAQSGICRAREPFVLLLSGFLQVSLALIAIVPPRYALGIAGGATFILMVTVVKALDGLPVLPSRRSAAHAASSSSALVTARAVFNLLQAAMTAVGGPAALVAGALWTQAHLAPYVGIRASWTIAVVLIMIGSIAIVTVWRQLVRSWNRE